MDKDLAKKDSFTSWIDEKTWQQADLSVFDLFISKDKYLENISSKKIIKKFKSGIIYQQNLFGQSEDGKIIQDIENSLVNILNTFINDWYQDNPMKQF